MIRDLLLKQKEGSHVTPPPGAIGDAYAGGFYYGKMTYPDGDYWMVIAPKSTEVNNLAYRISAGNDGLNYTGYGDGLANMPPNLSNYPAWNYVRGLTTGGFSDWYLWALDELELAYRNLKYSTTNNSILNPRDFDSLATGVNNNSNPHGAAYTVSIPTVCASPNFNSTAAPQVLLTASAQYYMTSTCRPNLPYVLEQEPGAGGKQSYLNNTGALTSVFIRAIRRVKVF